MPPSSLEPYSLACSRAGYNCSGTTPEARSAWKWGRWESPAQRARACAGAEAARHRGGPRQRAHRRGHYQGRRRGPAVLRRASGGRLDPLHPTQTPFPPPKPPPTPFCICLSEGGKGNSCANAASLHKSGHIDARAPAATPVERYRMRLLKKTRTPGTVGIRPTRNLPAECVHQGLPYPLGIGSQALLTMLHWSAAWRPATGEG